MYTGYIIAGAGIFLMIMNTVLTLLNSKKLKKESEELQRIFDNEYYK